MLKEVEIALTPPSPISLTLRLCIHISFVIHIGLTSNQLTYSSVMSLVILTRAEEMALAPLSPTLLLLSLFMKTNSVHVSCDTVHVDMLTLIFEEQEFCLLFLHHCSAWLPMLMYTLYVDTAMHA